MKIYYLVKNKSKFIIIFSIFLLCALTAILTAYLSLNYIQRKFDFISHKLDDIQYNQSIHLLQQQIYLSDKNSEDLFKKDIIHFNLKANNSNNLNLENKPVGIRLFNNSKKTITLQNFSINKKSLPVNNETLINQLTKNLVDDSEKAISIFNFVKSNLVWDYKDVPLDQNLNSLEYLFSRGKGLCTVQAKVLCDLAQSAGFQSRLIEFKQPGYHVGTEIYYNNSYHYFDPDGGYYIQKENKILSLEEIKKNISLLDGIEIRYSRNLIKEQIINENNKIWDCPENEFNLHNLEIKLLPGMSFWAEKNPLPPLSIGYRDRLLGETFLGYFEDKDFNAELDEVEFISGFGFEWLKFVTDKEFLEYKINDNDYIIKEAKLNGVVIISDLNNNDSEKINRITVRSAKNIKSYFIASKINPSTFPFLERGQNNIKFNTPFKNEQILLGYW